jgi:hypothetical protein
VRNASVAAASRPQRRRRAVACFLGATFLLELAVVLVPVRAAPVEGTSAVDLHDDDGGAALFGSDGLHPGRLDTACVALSTAGPAAPSDEVRLSAEVSNADLAPYLMLTVERGSAGAFGNCASFTGEPLWSGTLAEFPVTASSGIITGWRPGLVDRAIYRFTVTVADDARAQQRSAAATFVWTLDQTAEATAPAAPTLGPPPAGPVTAAPPSASDAPSSTPAPALPASGEAQPRADDVIQAPPLPVGPSSIEEVLEQVAETVLSIAQNGHFPAALVGVLVAFLTLQGAVDRRDPKLALARLSQDLREFRQFPESSRTENL